MAQSRPMPGASQWLPPSGCGRHCRYIETKPWCAGPSFSFRAGIPTRQNDTNSSGAQECYRAVQEHRLQTGCGKTKSFVIPRRAARRGISLFLRLNQREIPHFVRNDKIKDFFHSLFRACPTRSIQDAQLNRLCLSAIATTHLLPCVAARYFSSDFLYESFSGSRASAFSSVSTALSFCPSAKYAAARVSR